MPCESHSAAAVRFSPRLSEPLPYALLAFVLVPINQRYCWDLISKLLARKREQSLCEFHTLVHQELCKSQGAPYPHPLHNLKEASTLPIKTLITTESWHTLHTGFHAVKQAIS